MKTSLTSLLTRLGVSGVGSLGSLGGLFPRRGLLRRPTRNQLYLLAAAAALLVAVTEFIVIPVNETREDLAEQIAINKKRLRDLETIGKDYRQIRDRYATFKAGIDKRTPDFTLFAFLESEAAKVEAKDKIEFMRPSSKPLSATYQEEHVEMRLTKITLDRLVTFLHRVETAPEAVRVRRIAIQTQQPKNVVLDGVDLLFETYVPARPGAARK